MYAWDVGEGKSFPADNTVAVLSAGDGIPCSVWYNLDGRVRTGIAAMWSITRIHRDACVHVGVSGGYLAGLFKNPPPLHLFAGGYVVHQYHGASVWNGPLAPGVPQRLPFVLHPHRKSPALSTHVLELCHLLGLVCSCYHLSRTPPTCRPPATHACTMATSMKSTPSLVHPSSSPSTTPHVAHMRAV